MELIVGDPDNIGLYDFTDWLCDVISDFVDDNNLRIPSLEKKWDEFFEKTDMGWQKDDTGNPVPPTVSFIINQYFHNLVIKKKSSDYIITTDSNLFLTGTSLTIDELASIINNGNMGMPAYSYFNDIFQFFADNLSSFYEYFLEEQGG